MDFGLAKTTPAGAPHASSLTMTSCGPLSAQLAAQLAGAAAQLIYVGEDLTAAFKARRQVRDSVSRASNKRVCLVSLDSSGRFTANSNVT
jgi:hypothetical protein